MKKILGCILIIISVALFIRGGMFINVGFDKKNNYYSSEDYSNLNVNAYVGGDAYNYIINSNYFTGYLVLGSTMLLMGTICCVSGIAFSVDKQPKQVLKEAVINDLQSNELPPL